MATDFYPASSNDCGSGQQGGISWTSSTSLFNLPPKAAVGYTWVTRFAITIPTDATVTAAYLTMTVYSGSDPSQDGNYSIQVTDERDAAQPTSDPGEGPGYLFNLTLAEVPATLGSNDEWTSPTFPGVFNAWFANDVEGQAYEVGDHVCVGCRWISTPAAQVPPPRWWNYADGSNYAKLSLTYTVPPSTKVVSYMHGEYGVHAVNKDGREIH
jgi:hypothetical protein